MATYEVGDKVRIVKERTPSMNRKGMMDKHLDTVMTIIGEVNGCYRMEEDGGKWLWGDDMIFAKVCEDETPDGSGSSFAELFGLE